MSERQKSAFYGDDSGPTVLDVVATLRTLTGSEVCARELEAAANEVEAACPHAPITPMPAWVC